MVTPALLIGLWLIIVIQRVTELRLARRNLERMRERGARLVEEPHYWMFFVLHVGWLLAWPIEAWLRGPRLGAAWPPFVAAFVLAELLRYWAIASLGERWNTKIVVLDGVAPIRTGPYRLLAHPNYLAVAIELACVPLIFDAWISAAVVTLLDAGLLLGLRIPAEVAAMRATNEHPQ